MSLRNLQQPQGLFCILGCIQLEAQSDSRPQHWHRQLLFAIHSQWQLLHNFQNIFEICDVWWTKTRRFLCYICSPSVPERIGWIPFKKMLKASNGIRLLTASITVVLLVYRVLRVMTKRVTKMLKVMLAMTTTMTENLATFWWPAPSSLPTQIPHKKLVKYFIHEGI